jgi:hypothetical protein
VDATGRATVEFRLPPEAGAKQAWLAGEFNDWSVHSHPLRRHDDGSLTVTVELDPGSYRFRYYLGDGEWENDWSADAYVDNEHGGQDSLIVIPPGESAPPAVMGPTADAEPEPAPAPAKKAATKKKAAAKRADGTVKKTATKKKAAAKKKAPPSD